MDFLKLLHRVADYLTSWLNPRAHWGWMSYNRKNGILEREKQPLGKKLKLLLLFNPFTEWIDTTHAARLYLHNSSVRKGKTEGTPASKKDIRGFVEYYGINMDEFDPSSVDKYATFEDFITRAHKPGTRQTHAPNDPTHAVVVADSRLVVYESVAETKQLWIKGSDFSISSLVMDMVLGEAFVDGAVVSFRLSPQDYHRFHAPVTGSVKTFRSIPGDYYQVDAIALRSKVNILTRNRRQFVVIETEDFGDVLFVAIGATNVGTVRWVLHRANSAIHDRFQQSGQRIRKGEELGFFQFGGSSIIVAFQAGRIEFDQDLVDLSKQQIQVAVEVGMSLGRAVASTKGPSR